MNVALILAGGVGQRMRNSGMPKQFLEVFGKPIVIYTLEKFQNCESIDKIVVVCNAAWMDYMKELVNRYHLDKVINIVPGGKDRQSSIDSGIAAISSLKVTDADVIIIHDGVRPLVSERVIKENIEVAKRFGCAMTVRPAIETVVITSNDVAHYDNFKDRNQTYTLTSPQSFKMEILKDVYKKKKIDPVANGIPLLDTAMDCSYQGHPIHLVKENNHNIKITTPEDYYILKAILELQENKRIFGL